MARNRNRKKMALYEAIGKTRHKPRYNETLEQLHPDMTDEDKPTTVKSDIVIPERTARWPRRPRIVQFNAGRIELSIPYQLAVTLLLGIILLVLVAFRIGQNVSSRNSAKSVPEAVPQNTAPAGIGTLLIPADDLKTTSVLTTTEETEQAKQKGNNRIVIQTYQLKAHLEPVKNYFAQFGIQTEIRKIDNWYYLVTKDKYENPKKPGTDGYLAKQKIIEFGAQYKASQGYETFGSKPFYDAYGKKFDD